MKYDAILSAGLPIGSGAMESAIRRVVNLRLKGASIYWLEETAEAMLLLRSFYKSGRWDMLNSLACSTCYAMFKIISKYIKIKIRKVNSKYVNDMILIFIVYSCLKDLKY